MPMPSQDPLPQATDFLSLCEKCHKMVGDLWLVNGEYICNECYNPSQRAKVYNYKKIEINYSVSQLRWKNIRGWTKWAGANNGLYSITDEWFCQACTEKQTSELPSYLIKIKDKEYARICSVCVNIAIHKKINNIYDLREVVSPQTKDF